MRVELTGKQKAFCREYIFDFNASRAARVAGYSEATAGSIGSENLTKPEIQAYIKELQDDLAKTVGVSKAMILEEHKKLAFSSIAGMHNTWITRKNFETLTEEQKACIAEISTQTRMERNPIEGGDPIQVDYVKIKLYDKQKSLDSISKMLGFNEAEKVQHILPEKQVMYIGGNKIEF